MANETLNFTQGIAEGITPVDLPFMNHVIFENTVREYLIAILVFLAIMLGLKLFSLLIIKSLEHVNKKYPSHPKGAKEVIAKGLRALSIPLFLALGLKIASTMLVISPLVEKIIKYLLLVILTYYAIKVINAVIAQMSKRVIERREKEDKVTDNHLMNVFVNVMKGFVWILGALFLLSSFGVNVSKVFTGLGIAGVAVAFALQNILGDLFASFSIYFDKPFKPGDYIIFNGEEGTIIKTGLKSTRIKLLKGDELVVSNKFLTESKLENVERMERRRVDLDLQIKYGTPKSKLKNLPEQLENIVKKYKKDVDFDRCHLKAFRAYNIEFELVYFIKKSDYRLFMDIQQKINFDILDLFEKEGIEFALPTTAVVLEGKK